MTSAELAVVGGGTGALGRAIVARLLASGLGVVAVARSASAGMLPPEVITVDADLASDAAVDRVASVLDGPVRMVVQAAGLPGGGDLSVLEGEVIGSAMDGKVGGFLRLIRAAQAHLEAGSRLVALGGHYGYEPSPAAPLAGMVNAALANLVRALAAEHGPAGITAHLVAPGPVESPRMTAIASRVAAASGASVSSVLDDYRAASPLGRLTTADEVAWAVALLLDPCAAALTGGALSLDAGRRKGI